MKKNAKALVAALAMLLTLATGTAAHDGVTNAEWGTPVIDGVRGDAWANAQSILVEDISITNVLEEYATGEVWSLWDGEYIYFFAEITDPTVDAVSRDDAWNQDAVGFMIDYAYDRTPEKSFRDLGDASYAGYVNVAAIPGDANAPEGPTIFGIEAYKNAIQSMCVKTDAGYDVEIRLPLSLYKEYAAGDKLGYEICLNNSIGGGARDSQAVWKYADDANGQESWQYTANMGTLILNAQPAAEVAEEPVPEVVEEPATEPVVEAAEVVEVAEVVETVEAPVAEPVVEAPVVVTTAPQTFDAGILLSVAAMASLAGYTVSKKNRK